VRFGLPRPPDRGKILYNGPDTLFAFGPHAGRIEFSHMIQ
jgi:hypothetical protein